MPRLQDETVARSSDNFRLPVLFISLVPRLRRAFPMIGRARGVSECVRTAQGPKMLSGGKGIKEYLRMRKGVMSPSPLTVPSSRQRSRTEKASATVGGVPCLHAKVGLTAWTGRADASTSTAAAWQFC